MKTFLGIVYLVLFQVSCYAGDLKEDGEVTFYSPSGEMGSKVVVEFAKTGPERTKGLMYRRELPEGHGMLFFMPTNEIQSFWMKNTYIPLDIIFISEEMVVNTVLSDVPPLTLTQRKSVAPSRYVLELIGGSANRLGIRQGSKVVITEK